MTRSEGFAVMDVSTSICDDSKFRRLQRETPEQVAIAFTAYIATMAESWKAGRRVTVDDAWPSFIPYDAGVIDAMHRVKLLDGAGRVMRKAWDEWFELARQRRDTARERWTRSNAQRSAARSQLPRGNGADTAATVPLRSSPIRTVRPSESENGFTAEPSPRIARRARSAAGDPS
jgi:hypothetical protein